MAEAARSVVPRPIHYQRRRPEEGVLYQLVQEYVETFFAEVQARTGSALPKFVRDEFDRYLECGVLACGFLRLRCGACGHEKLVAFSCKGRGFCPSCGGRRMAETAAYLVDQVIPEVPVRQWVLSFPMPLRLLFAAYPELLTPTLAIVHREIRRFLVHKTGVRRGQTGAVTLVQRFGSAANLNIHLHGLVLDGVYQSGKDDPVFHLANAPTPEELDAILQRIIHALMKRLTRSGHLHVEEEGSGYLSDLLGEGSADPGLSTLQWASCTYRIAFGPNAGRSILRRQDASRVADTVKPGCVSRQGFSLHAGIRCRADQRRELERLCRYITRPALSHERVARSAGGDVILTLKTPWRDGTSHLTFTPLEFLQRLAALVPRPRLHLTRFHGVLAPNARLRREVLPHKAADPEPSMQPPRRSARMGWAKLLRRVFRVDLEHCPDCGGDLKLVAAILDGTAVVKILTHLGLPARAPPRAPARMDAELDLA